MGEVAAERNFGVDGISGGGADSGVEEMLLGEEGEVDGEEAAGQRVGGLGLVFAGVVGEGCGGGSDGVGGGVELAAADGGEAVVGGDEDVGVGFDSGVFVEPGEELGERVVGVAEAAGAGFAVDAGGESLEAVAFVVLGAVGVARPEEEDEGFVLGGEGGEDELGGDVGKPLDLGEVGGAGAGGDGVAGEAVGPG